jgi:hypothetical protein
MRRLKNILTGVGALVLVALVPARASAGSIYLTGHDVELHTNQNGYSTVILNWLRGAGTASEIAAGGYDILFFRSAEIGGSATAPGGFGTVTTADPTTFDWTTLGNYDVIEIASHFTCGGCDLTTADSDTINAHAAEIQAFFNAGGDIWANAGATLLTYYNFLPPGSTAIGTSIGDACGFVATAAGLAIGIDGGACGSATTMINGFQTHSEFTSFSAVFTVFETRSSTGGAISLGVRDATIIDTAVVDPRATVPEPATLLLLGGGLAAAAARRRRAKK